MTRWFGFIAIGLIWVDCKHDPVVEQLSALPGVTVSEATSSPALGYSLYNLTFTQPLDHDDPNSITFAQRATLLHRDFSAPMVFETEGYGLDDAVSLDELAPLVGGNQLNLEHRFYNSPVPRNDNDWQYLTIAQSAADQHTVVALMKRLYNGKWINTGGSLGGDNAIYHRRFYPTDVDVTVAYVAPVTFGLADPRYPPYLASLGPASCHAALTAFQSDVLAHRSTYVTALSNWASTTDQSFTLYPPDAALEDTVVAVPFTLFQYSSVDVCNDVPTASASIDTAFNFIVDIGLLSEYNDDQSHYYAPFDYQTATELGAPALDTSVIATLLHHQNDPDPTLPTGLTLTFNPAAMTDVDAWCQSSAHQMIYIYGANDPWSAGKVSVGSQTDVFEVVAPAANHEAQIASLSATDRNRIYGALSAWLGVSVSVPSTAATVLVTNQERLSHRRWRARRRLHPHFISAP